MYIHSIHMCVCMYVIIWGPKHGPHNDWFESVWNCKQQSSVHYHHHHYVQRDYRQYLNCCRDNKLATYIDMCTVLKKMLQYCGIGCSAVDACGKATTYDAGYDNLYFLFLVKICFTIWKKKTEKNNNNKTLHLILLFKLELSVCLVNPCQMKICIKFNKSLVYMYVY